MTVLTAQEIIDEYALRGVQFSNESELINDQQWLAECVRCSVCESILLHDDEAYYDDELNQPLCDKHSIITEHDEEYKRRQNESFRLEYNLNDLSYKLLKNDGVIQLFHKGEYVTHLTIYDECESVYEDIEEDIEDIDLSYVVINYEIVRLYDLREIK